MRRILAVSAAVWVQLAWCQQHFGEGGDIVTLGAGNSESGSYQIPHMAQASSDPWNPKQYENNNPYRNTYDPPKPMVQNAMQKRAASAFDREVRRADAAEQRQVLAHWARTISCGGLLMRFCAGRPLLACLGSTKVSRRKQSACSHFKPGRIHRG